MKGHVYQRGNSWTYVIDLPPDPTTGKRRQKSKGGFQKEKEAEAACAEEMTKINKGLYIDEQNITLGEYLDTWLEEYAKPNYKPTVYDVESAIVRSRIIPVIGKQKLQQIKPLTITRFYNQLLQKYSAEYVRHIHAILRKAFNQAEQWELLLTNPIKKVTSPKLKKKEMKIWTMEQCLHFLSVATGHVHYIVYALAIHTGMRKGEVLGLRWRDVDFDNRILRVQQTVNWTPSQGIIIQDTKTDSSQRNITIGDMLIQALKQQRKLIAENKIRHGKEYKDFDLVCCYENGEPIKPRRITETFDYLTRKAELPKIRFHDLRHSHATMLLENKVNAKVGAERLGHSSVQIFLDRYSHLLPNMQQEAADALEEAMKKAQKAVDN